LLAWNAFRGEYGTVPLLSDVDLAIHEFGHMLFMPFGIQFLGSTMMILGGSLTQVVFPLLFFGYFMRKRDDGRRRDVFAAMVCLWWSAINLLDVSIYCADSRAGELTLLDGLTGKESDGHDWNNLLTRWGLLEHDTAIARYMRAIAALVCVASIVIAVWSARQLPREQLGEAVEA
jgi:predicted membrane-bound mannosyltransferase